jgi:hypothetical protein
MTPLAVTAPATFSAVCTFVHVIAHGSPLWRLSQSAAQADGLCLQCVLAAHDPIYDGGLTAVQVYKPDDFAWGHRPADVMRRDPVNGKMFVDFTKFNRTAEAPSVMQARAEQSAFPLPLHPCQARRHLPVCSQCTCTHSPPPPSPPPKVRYHMSVGSQCTC